MIAALSTWHEQHEAAAVALARLGVFGGASYDGLVALEAKAHARTLLTLDERAQSTYRRVSAEFVVI